MRKILLIALQGISLFVMFFLLILQDKLPDGFKLYTLMPLSFFVGTFFLYKNFFSTSMRFLLTNIGILIMFFLRMVLSPLFSALSGWYFEAAYAPMIENNLSLAILLISYECFISFLFLGLISKPKVINQTEKYDLKLIGNNLFYIVFILFGIIVFLLWGRNGLVSFGILTSDIGERIGDNTNQFLNLVIQIIKITCTLLFLLLLSLLQKSYTQKKSFKLVLFAIILAVLNTSVIVGERRTIMLFTAISSFLLIIVVFKKYRNQILLWGILSTLILLGLASFYKSYLANQFGSYSDAISNTTFTLSDISQDLQAYFTGPQNVSIAILTRRSHSPNFLNLLYDFARSFFGFNFLVKDRDMSLTSELFNNVFYSSNNYKSGHILSSIGFGYYYFGAILAPIFTIFHIKLSTIIEKILNKSRSYESLYFWSYILSRVIFNIYYSTPSMIIFITQNMFTLGLVFLIGSLISRKGKANINTDENYNLL
ncbi:O-antigen polymerase [Enterococcus songbeiensis]|uniref:O-antigen polymerase n=1 Tax=Enterococcus songbeiensis TaxID=2559927 RepID=UPI0010F7F24A|nr:O-antigen polymerase [Enterococcus songbeiensis]